MYAKIKKSKKENKSRAVANTVVQKKSNGKQGFGFVDNRLEAITQRALQEKATNKTNLNTRNNVVLLQRYTNSPSGVIQRGKWYYAYGSADTIPHIHVNKKSGDCHLKILHRKSIKRYNIVKNGKRHAQADLALEAAAGNEKLVSIINKLLEGY